MNGKHHLADASKNTSKPNQPRPEAKPRMPAKTQANHTSVADTKKTYVKQPAPQAQQTPTTKPESTSKSAYYTHQQRYSTAQAD
ncbi:hypothetical protein PTKU46_41400 [Paraburkholderia terrae]